jgi:hypothetical protein
LTALAKLAAGGVNANEVEAEVGDELSALA